MKKVSDLHHDDYGISLIRNHLVCIGVCCCQPTHTARLDNILAFWQSQSLSQRRPIVYMSLITNCQLLASGVLVQQCLTLVQAIAAQVVPLWLTSRLSSSRYLAMNSCCGVCSSVLPLVTDENVLHAASHPDSLAFRSLTAQCKHQSGMQLLQRVCQRKPNVSDSHTANLPTAPRYKCRLRRRCAVGVKQEKQTVLPPIACGNDTRLYGSEG